MKPMSRKISPANFTVAPYGDHALDQQLAAIYRSGPGFNMLALQSTLEVQQPLT
jgi:hypothetical protein